MPQISVVYTPSLRGILDVDRLTNALHEAARSSGLFAQGAIRVMASECAHAVVGDGRPENGFIQINVVLAPGRGPDVKAAMARDLLAAADRETDALFTKGPLGLQLAVSEFDGAATLRRNNMTPPEG